MNRRQFLGTIALAAGAALSGCVTASDLEELRRLGQAENSNLKHDLEKKLRQAQTESQELRHRLEERLRQEPVQKKEELVRHIRGIQKNMVTLETTTKYIISYGSRTKPAFRIISGEGLIYRDYILTTNHLIELTEKAARDDLKKKIGPDFNLEEFSFEKYSEITFLGDERIEEMFSDPEKDIGIIPYKKPRRSDYVVELGDSDELDLLDELYIVGRPFSLYPVVKGGIMGSEREKGINPPISSEIVTDHRAIGGDSGSPLINLDGKVVGIVANIIKESHALSIPINEYKKAIAKYEKTRLEAYELKRNNFR